MPTLIAQAWFAPKVAASVDGAETPAAHLLSEVDDHVEEDPDRQ
ncbi:MAG: hypothetical protein ABSD48_12635 [Armatimonadota bacterium]